MTSMFLIGVVMAATGMQPTATAASAQVTSSRDDRVVCRRDDQIGTRLAPRVCLTRAQWRQREVEERRTARDTMNDLSQASGVTDTREAANGAPGPR